MRYMALDIALNTGVAIHDAETVEFLSDKINIADADAMEREKAYHDSLWHKLMCYDPIDVLVIENPTPQSKTAATIQYGLLALSKLAALERDIAYILYYPATVKKITKEIIPQIMSEDDRDEYFEETVKQNMMLPKSRQAKESKFDSLILFQAVHGFYPPSHDEADALALLISAMIEQDYDTCLRSLQQVITDAAA